MKTIDFTDPGGSLDPIPPPLPLSRPLSNIVYLYGFVFKVTAILLNVIIYFRLFYDLKY